MRLLNVVSQSKSRLEVETPDGTRHTLPNASAIAPRINAAPLRYVLEDPVTEFVAKLAFEQSGQVVNCLDLTRFSAPALWIEWNDAARLSALRVAGFSGRRRQSGRCGALITTDAAGRRGAVDIVWSTEDGGADLSPLAIDFDLDATHRQDGDIKAWRVSLPDHRTLETILERIRVRLRPEWLAFYRNQGLCDADLRRVIADIGEMVAGDFPFVVALQLVLQARNATSFRRVACDRLNQARARYGKQPLLDYIEVVAQLDRPQFAGAAPALASRSAVRRHFVSGHLVRRAGRVFWRRPHLRGDIRAGAISGRTVRLAASNAREKHNTAV